MSPRAASTAAVLLAAPFLIGALAAGAAPGRGMPWAAAGLSEREAAAFLLDRFTYGPRPGEVDRVLARGLDAWLEDQLAGDLPEPALEAELAGFDALGLSAGEMAESMMASARGDDPEEIRRLLGELMAWKLYRSLLAENQLREVLTDFWYEHLYVSLADAQVRPFLLAYERDAIAPNALGSFPALLAASARHPAMLAYLDNAASTAEPGARTTLEVELDRLERGGRRPGAGGGGGGERAELRGLNENYARELLELHTLGVDGGYTEEDVREVARAFSGWSILPPGERGEEVRRNLARAERFGGLGFVLEGDFLFRADAHDAEPKTVLGRRLPARRGIEDGEAVLELLAGHPATARHVARALAVRFVADDPPASLVERLAGTFLATGGDVSELIRTLVASEELWADAARRETVKSPFELAVSALRALGAEVESPFPLLRQVDAMGQRPYGYPAPTGYPETAEGRLDAGTLFGRLELGAALAAGRLPGVRYDPDGVLGASGGSGSRGRGGVGPEALLEAAIEALLPGRGLGTQDFAAAGPPPADPREALALVLSSPQFQTR